MATYAVVKTGGKQYLVKEADQIVVEHLEGETGAKVDLTTLSIFDNEELKVEFGAPLKQAVVAEIIEQGKGEKVRIAKFKSKVRYRKVRGFRPTLTKLQIVKI
ncbi:50S ribosomal protein L21 [Candidatus Microgenomates bacterium]|nr:50S ribosomal protein L21 [Candidatus Microgenomates bacterium]